MSVVVRVVTSGGLAALLALLGPSVAEADMLSDDYVDDCVTKKVGDACTYPTKSATEPSRGVCRTQKPCRDGSAECLECERGTAEKSDAKPEHNGCRAGSRSGSLWSVGVGLLLVGWVRRRHGPTE